MKILLDLQGAQTESRHRGIGRYSLSLAKAIVNNRGRHQVILLANGAFGSELSQLRDQFELIEGEVEFLIFDTAFPVAEKESVNVANSRLAEMIRERLISAVAPDAVLLTSLFEGFLDDAVTSVGRLGRGPLTAVVLYDLIPFLRKDPAWPQEYLRHYEGKIESLKRSDLMLSISDYARNEAVSAIPELASRIVNMSSACNADFNVQEVTVERKAELFLRYGIRGSFVMSAGNVEPRKNFELLVAAFGMLPESVRRNRKIVLVGSVNDARTLELLKSQAAAVGLEADDLVITGHVSDDDLRDLYRLCELFVFPSRHEGFGLPPLEAMSCGAAVLGSNATSVPEVIGRAHALFDPDSTEELAALMQRAFTDELYLASLKAEGVAQAENFSWDKTACKAIQALEEFYYCRRKQEFYALEDEGERPRLAMVTPLPPEQTGIADYVAALLPDLGKLYDITVVTDQAEVADWVRASVREVRTIAWFEAHAADFSRVVYQVGNSPFHVHMLDLMHRIPGVAVLHDFFLTGLLAWMELTGFEKDAFRRALRYSHGYRAVSYFESRGLDAAKMKWPCSLDVISAAQGLILNSEHSRNLVRLHYGDQFDNKITVNKLNREPAAFGCRLAARARLGLSEEDFVVCAFGFMDQTKLNDRLLGAWASSGLGADRRCRLVFVGGQAEPTYAERINTTIASIDGGARIAITGFASREVFEDYLCAADVGVQLRTLSRGETSGTVLDCLAHGVPVIINANGSMAEYPDNVLIKLRDDFETEDLVAALQRLHSDQVFRETLAAEGVEYVRRVHAPEVVAQGYAEAIEKVAQSETSRVFSRAVLDFWSRLPRLSLPDRSLLARRFNDEVAIARRPVIYIDVSATARNDLRTGIERVTRALLREILMEPPIGYDVKPAYLSEENGRWRVRVANSFLAKQVEFSAVELEDEVAVPGRGDVLIALDLFSDGVISAARNGLYQYWHAAGAKVGFMVHDILPVTHPHFFPAWAKPMHESWLKAIIKASDFIVCISRHVKGEVQKWMDAEEMPLEQRPRLEVSHHGADVRASFPTTGFPRGADRVLGLLKQRPTFLMVGTIEPRKRHLLVLQAFEILWRECVDVNLVIVGHEGWIGLPDHERRTIPETISAFRSSAEIDNRLFWLNSISDEYLERLYVSADALIAASEDEGFGLPLIEAAQYGVPILASDIDVFYEVAGEGASYFSSSSPEGLACELKSWLFSREAKKLTANASISWKTWAESSREFLRVVRRCTEGRLE